jgi:hypothetical protein
MLTTDTNKARNYRIPIVAGFLVGDTGIEPVTPTVSMLSPERWLLSLTLDTSDFLNLRR